MQTPIVVIASPDERLCRTANDELAPHASIRLTTQLEDAVRLAQENAARLVALDVRKATDGGRAADRAVERLFLLADTPAVAILTDDPCPEVLQRRADCTPLVHHRGPISGAELARLALRTLQRELADTEPEVAILPEDSDAAQDQFSEIAFGGATKRFETRSPQLKRMLEDLFIAAAHDITILLIGETGSGKTFLSNLIHDVSPRRNQPFLHVACGALPRELIESELFGHVKGAFTSAHADKDGKFLAAGKGTVLLDEIDVLGLEQQVKLLRVIETGDFEPVGSNRTFRSQARLVVASNLDLQPLVEQNRFRPDLYYRLSMLKFEIPPLRKRRVDIIPLARKFIARFQEKHGVRIHRVEESVLDALLCYPWPGNVRELEHVVQRAVIYCRNGVLTCDQLPSHILAGQAGPANDPSVSLGQHARAADQSLGKQVQLTEKEIIEQSLFKNNFSRTKTARDLGISRVTLYNKMKKYEMLK